MNLLTTVGKLLGPFGKFCLKVPWEKKKPEEMKENYSSIYENT